MPDRVAVPDPAGGPSRETAWEDVPTDALVGKRTLAVRLGEVRSRRVYAGLVVLPVLRLLTALPLGLMVRLAAPQLNRHPSRTSLTVGVLSLALAVAVCFGQTLHGILADLRHWYGQTIVADGELTDNRPGGLVRGPRPAAAS